MVQPELHPEDERRQSDGDTRQPHPDEAAAGVPEAVAQTPAPESVDAQLAAAYRSAESDVVSPHHRDASESIEVGLASPQPALFTSSEAVAIAAEPAADLHLTSPGIRLAQVQEEIVAWIKTLLSAAVYAILIVTFGFQVARVEGQSMSPTLEDQDRLIVNKLVYRLSEPRRNDIVMLYYPLNPEKSFVKRVIAEEQDTVRIVDGRVYVNDVPLNDEYVPGEFRSHDDWGPQVVPEGYYFVMGDHRNNSSDSRHWGFVPKRYIIGKVQLRWWPVPEARGF